MEREQSHLTNLLRPLFNHRSTVSCKNVHLNLYTTVHGRVITQAMADTSTSSSFDRWTFASSRVFWPLATCAVGRRTDTRCSQQAETIAHTKRRELRNFHTPTKSRTTGVNSACKTWSYRVYAHTTVVCRCRMCVYILYTTPTGQYYLVAESDQRFLRGVTGGLHGLNLLAQRSRRLKV